MNMTCWRLLTACVRFMRNCPGRAQSQAQREGNMIKTTPRVSIGLPVYNAENYLVEALDSLLAQTFTDFELIISDNASTDQTPALCQAYMAQDQRIRYVRNAQNQGSIYNHN